MKRFLGVVTGVLVVLGAASLAQAAPPGPPPVPEIDPSMAVGALTLLAGGVLALTGIRRSR